MSSKDDLNEMKEKVYIETTIPSYLISQESRDIIVLSHQIITKNWWDTCRQKYELFFSETVYNECMRGDGQLAQRKIELLRSMIALPVVKEVEDLALCYKERLKFPDKIANDLIHIAYAVVYKMDYLLTWNCKHIANAHIQSRLKTINEELGLKTPVICTPEELNNYLEEVQDVE